VILYYFHDIAAALRKEMRDERWEESGKMCIPILRKKRSDFIYFISLRCLYTFSDLNA
jgi:hypothetical protein